MKSTSWRVVAALLVTTLFTTGSVQADEGVFAGVDLLFLSPKISSVGIYNIFNYDNAAVLSSDGNFNSELQFAQRVILGYEGDQGGGVQIRWFGLDQTVSYAGVENHGSGDVALSGETIFDVDAFDVEFTQRGSFRTWDWQGTAGVRIGSLSVREDSINGIDWEGFADFAWVGNAGVEFDGAGPTASVRGNREILWDGFSIFGGVRTALLFGDLEQYRYFSGRFINPDETVQVWEMQAGIEMEHEYDSIDCILRIFWEAQRWDSESNLLGDVGLHGFGVHTGIEY